MPAVKNGLRHWRKDSKPATLVATFTPGGKKWRNCVVIAALAVWLAPSGPGGGSTGGGGGGGSCDADALLSWFAAGGGKLHPALQIESGGGGGGGRHAQRRLVAGRGAVAEGDPLVLVPHALALRAATATAQAAPFAKLRRAAAAGAGSPYMLVSFDSSGGSVAEIYALAARLLVERALPGSPWSHYVRCLPGSSTAAGEGDGEGEGAGEESCPGIFCASDAELAALQSATYAGEARHDRDAVEAARRAVDWPALAAAHELTAAAALALAPSPRRWRWAVSMVLSRRLGQGDEHALAPVADLLNHAPDPRWSAMGTSPAGFAVGAKAAVARGEEVYLRYAEGSMPAWNVLRAWGFVLPGGGGKGSSSSSSAAIGGGRQHTAVQMAINHELSSPPQMRRAAAVLAHLAPDRVSILDRQGTTLQAVLSFDHAGVGGSGGSLDAATLGFCRILSLPPRALAMLGMEQEEEDGEEEKEEEEEQEEESEKEGSGGGGERGGRAAAATRAKFGTLDRPVHPANEAEALDLASRALDALAAEWEGTTTLAQDEELLAGAALSARGRTFVQFRALRKRVVAVNRAALKGLLAAAAPPYPSAAPGKGV